MFNSRNNNYSNKKGKPGGEPTIVNGYTTHLPIWSFRLYETIDLYKNLAFADKVFRIQSRCLYIITKRKSKL